MEKDYVIGIDLGGQSTKIGIVDRMGSIIAQNSMKYSKQDPKQYNEEDAEEFMKDLCAAIKTLIDKVGMEKIKGIGIGAPNGNYYSGTIEDAANLPWAKGKKIELAKTVSNYFEGLSVTVTNDANAAAVGEMTYGAAKGMKNFIEITLGTGVGSGIVINGEVVYGNDGFAGELGHTCAIKDNGRNCNCGKVGCLETYCSAIGVARTAREWLEVTDEPSLLRDLSNITSKEVYEAAKKGDELSIKIFDFTAKILGRQFADFVAFSAPQAIILFGGLTHAKEFLVKKIKKYMDDELLSVWRGKVQIIVSSLKESDAAILGAASLAW
jgi:glucokinase